MPRCESSSNTITIGGDLDQSILLATDDVGDVIIGQDMEYAAIVSLTGSVGNVDVAGFMWFDLIGAIGGAIEYVYDIVDRLDILIGLFGDFQLDPVMDAYLASLAIDPTIANNVGNITVGRGEDDLGGFKDYVAILAFNGDIGSISVGGDMTHTAAVATGNVGSGNSITVDDDMFQDAIYALGGAIGDVTVISVDTIGYVKITDTLQLNKISGRGFTSYLKIPEKTITITNTIYPKPTRQLYIGGGIYTSQSNVIDQIQMSLLLKNKKDQMFGISGGMDFKGEWMIGVESYWKIKLKK